MGVGCGVWEEREGCLVPVQWTRMRANLMGLKVTNTLTRSKEAFVPQEPGRVRMYVCGPTVYGHGHLTEDTEGMADEDERRFFG